MAVDRSQANLQKLKEADEIQEKTKAAVTRIQRQVAATEEMAITSLEELRKQGQQMVSHFSKISIYFIFLFKFLILKGRNQS
jgi:hypothetical protein